MNQDLFGSTGKSPDYNEVGIDEFWALSEGHNHNQVTIEDLFWVLGDTHNHNQVAIESDNDRVDA